MDSHNKNDLSNLLNFLHRYTLGYMLHWMFFDIPKIIIYNKKWLVNIGKDDYITLNKLGRTSFGIKFSLVHKSHQMTIFYFYNIKYLNNKKYIRCKWKWNGNGKRSLVFNTQQFSGALAFARESIINNDSSISLVYNMSNNRTVINKKNGTTICDVLENSNNDSNR